MELSIVPLTKSLYQWRGKQRRPLPPPPGHEAVPCGSADQEEEAVSPPKSKRKKKDTSAPVSRPPRPPLPRSTRPPTRPPPTPRPLRGPSLAGPHPRIPAARAVAARAARPGRRGGADAAGLPRLLRLRWQQRRWRWQWQGWIWAPLARPQRLHVAPPPPSSLLPLLRRASPISLLARLAGGRDTPDAAEPARAGHRGAGPHRSWGSSTDAPFTWPPRTPVLELLLAAPGAGGRGGAPAAAPVARRFNGQLK